MHPQAVKALCELNIKYFFTDSREFKRKGNTEMYKLAVAHIKRLLADPKNKTIDDYYEQLCSLESQAQEVRICLE